MMALRQDDYTVAWICALPLEMAAAKLMLNQVHSSLPQPETDHNTYILGSIFEHNVVVACLPSGVYGTISAAIAIAQMLPTFTSLRFSLMVGIGGGVPSEKADIRLGDVVVGMPTAASGGVIQYDYGKTLHDGRLHRTGSLNKPPRYLLTVLSRMRCDDLVEGLSIERDIMKTLDKDQKAHKVFARPDHDWLFEATCEHSSMVDGCSLCDKSRLVQRAARVNNETHIHYGLIASGNQVMRDAQTRDSIAKELGVLCFEMEAAGLMDQLPCIVIRGICDYSDSHKQKEWQGFAALAAATYTKALLSAVPLTCGAVSMKKEFTGEEKSCLAKLFITDPEQDLNILKRRKGVRTSGTFGWFLGSAEFKRWFRQAKPVGDIDDNVLWLYGNPGIGKSTMAMMLAEEVSNIDPFFNEDRIVSFFFCDAGSEHQKNATSVLRGLLYQIIKKHPFSIEEVLSRYEVQGERLFTSFDALWAALLDIGRVSKDAEIYCIVDALDECEAESQDILLQQICQSFREATGTRMAPSNLHLLILSRPYPEIKEHLSLFRHVDLGSYKEIANDLRAMIQDKVRDLTRRKMYSESVAQKVSRILEEKADGTFLWVGIACEELKRVQSRKAIETLLARPHGLYPLYETLLREAIETSNENDYSCMKSILVIVTFALRPLTIAEIAEASRLYLDEDISTRTQFTREIIDLCRLLIVVDNGHVRLLHTSVQEFLMAEMHEIKANRSHCEISCRCIEMILKYCRPGLDILALEPTHGFLGYSVPYWPQHARLAEAEFVVQKEHEQFFEDQLEAWSCWLENYNHVNNSWGCIKTNLSAIHAAARWGIIPLISKLRGKGLEEKDADGQSPLLIAAEYAQFQAIRVLVESGACLDALNNKRQNVLHVACQNGRFEDYALIKFLLDKGASPYICDEENMIPFLYAIGDQWEELARTFLQNGFNLNTRVRRQSWPGTITMSRLPYGMFEHHEESIESGVTALHFSALNASTKMTAFLLQHGANPNARSDFGDTAIHIAIRRRLLGHTTEDAWDTGRYAIETLRDLITDHDGSEASDIYRAIDNTKIRIVETLLESGSININMANIQGDYPQHVIDFDQPCALSILDKLVERGVDTSLPNRAGQTCLHLAAKAGNLEIVRKLVEEGHDVLLLDGNGMSPFHYALDRGISDVLHFMSSACECITPEVFRDLDHSGKSPLHHHVSSIFCSAEVVSLLLQLGCDANQSDAGGNSPLTLYMKSFHLSIKPSVFWLLIANGADPLWVNQYGQNLAHLLMHYLGADTKILQFLFDQGLDPEAKDLDGKTLMHHGAIHGAFTRELVEFLDVQDVLRLYTTDLAFKTPLHYAEEQAHKKEIEEMQFWNGSRWKESFNNLTAIIESRKCSE